MISLDQLVLFTRCFAPLNEDTYSVLVVASLKVGHGRWRRGVGGAEVGRAALGVRERNPQ